MAGNACMRGFAALAWPGQSALTVPQPFLLPPATVPFRTVPCRTVSPYPVPGDTATHESNNSWSQPSVGALPRLVAFATTPWFCCFSHVRLVAR
jgi:hypothetical protein